MQNNPLVTVICLCYNHHEFVEEAINSVLNQTYDNIQIIVVDDGSTDGSPNFLEEFCALKNLELHLLSENCGNCKAFNQGFAKAKGKYIIDFATDDVMLPERIEHQVRFFENKGEKVGVIYSNCELIDKDNNHLGYHHSLESDQKLMPSGDVFSELLQRYFIAAPSMMMKTDVLHDLGGYDESLAYEDFDFWIRSSRHYHYAYQHEVLTKIRKLNSSLGHQVYRPGDLQASSTYLVCKKAKALLSNKKEENALVIRLKYEARQATVMNNFNESRHFLVLLESIQPLSIKYKLINVINRLKLDLSFFKPLLYLIFK